MQIKHAFITCLLVFHSPFLVNAAGGDPPKNPECVWPGPGPDDKEAHFLFLVDKLIEPELLSRLNYLLKAISCEIPAVEKIRNLVMSYSNEHIVPGTEVLSSGIESELYRDIKDKGVSTSSPCDRFRRALGRAPSPFLEHSNVQFIVPIFEEGPADSGCFLKAFQDQYKDHPRKKNFFFNGILINSEINELNNQSIRMTIPDLETAVNTSRVSLHASEVIGEVHESAHLVQSYASMMRDILLGKSVHDWDEMSTSTIRTTLIPTSTIIMTSEIPTTTTTFENFTTSEFLDILNFTTTNSSESPTTSLDNFTILIQNVSTTTPPKNESIVANLSNVAFIIDVDDDDVASNTTESIQNSTIILDKRAHLEINESTTMNLEGVATPETTNTTSLVFYDENEEEEGGKKSSEDDSNLDTASGMRKNKNATLPEKLVVFDDDDRGFPSIDADLLIYILLLLLLIWLFCLMMCLIWMFSCAKKKKNKLEYETEELNQQRVPLLLPEPTPQPPKLSTKSSKLSDSDEDDAEWNNIKPAIYTDSTAPTNQSKSEMESVKEASGSKKYAPVEVSEFEEATDEVTRRQRRLGEYEKKRTSALHFD